MSPAPRTTTATIPLPPDGVARIVVVADTHSKPHAMLCARLAESPPAAILHAGDIGDHTVIDMLSGFAPVYAVRGNIDVHAPDLPDQLVIDVLPHAAADGPRPAGPLRILLVHIAVYGPRLRADVGRAARSAGANLVVCGHSHVPFIGADRGLVVFNPGSVGPRRFNLPIVLGVIGISPAGVQLRHIDCETGREWTPHTVTPP